MSKELDEFRYAFLLLQLLEEEGGMMKSKINSSVSAVMRRNLDLKAAKDLNAKREELVPVYIGKENRKTPKGGTATYYSITPKGCAYLVNLKQYPMRLVVNGKTINRLVELVREGTNEFSQPDGYQSSQASTVSIATAVDVEQAALDAISFLSKERFAHDRLVPICELRAEMRQRFGEALATHEVLDPKLRKLRSEKQIRMVPIGDPSNASSEQLNDSVPGVHETLFYVELLS